MPNRRTSKNLAHRVRLKMVRAVIDKLTDRKRQEQFRRDQERFWEREYMGEFLPRRKSDAEQAFEQEYAAQSEAQEAQSYYSRAYLDSAREAAESSQGEGCQDEGARLPTTTSSPKSSNAGSA